MKPRYTRSDIPYKDRLLLQRYQTMAEHREHAARTALLLAGIALNDVCGLGKARIKAFDLHLSKLISEYYDDPELGDAHIQQRYKQLGFSTDEIC